MLVSNYYLTPIEQIFSYIMARTCCIQWNEWAWVVQWVRLLDYLTIHTSLSPILRGFAPGFVDYKKWCTRFAAASDKVYQLLAHGRWFSPGTLTSSTTKTGRHDIAEILLKVPLNTINQIKSNQWNEMIVMCTLF